MISCLLIKLGVEQSELRMEQNWLWYSCECLFCCQNGENYCCTFALVLMLLFSSLFFWIWNSNLSCFVMSFVTMWDHLVQNLWYHALSNFHFFNFEWFSSNVILNSILIFFSNFQMLLDRKCELINLS